MLIHFYGLDTYRRGRAAAGLINKYQKKYPNAVVGYFNCKTTGELQRFKQFASSPGLFSGSILAVITNPADGEKALAKFLKEIIADNLATIIVVADKKLPKDFAFLYNQKEVSAREFPPLSGLEFLKFLKADAKERGLVIADSALRGVGEVYDGDLWGAITELERVSYGGIITTEVEYDFLQAIRNLTSGQSVATRLRGLNSLLVNEDSAKVFNMAAAFTYGKAKIQMADYDLAIKSGKLGYDEALLEYALG